MNKNIRRMIFIAMYVALSIVLDFIKEGLPFLNMPQGGSINIALIPIVFASFHLGYKDGLITGLLWWLISSLLGLNKYFLNIPQYLLDYVIPSCIIGASSIFYKNKSIFKMEMGILLMMFIRTLSILISGAYFWMDDLAQGSIAAWVASISYNLPYSVATCGMLMLITPILLRTLSGVLDRYEK